MDNFETLLKSKGLTKTAFSDLLGIKKQNLNGLLKNPTLETMKKIASALGCNIVDLFGSPTSDFTALVKCGQSLYSAASIEELKALITDLEQQNI